MSGFRYKRTKKWEKLPSVNALPPAEPPPAVGGTIDGLSAAQGELNLFNAAYKSGAVASHVFRMAVGAPKNKPGWKELDFLFLGKTGEYTAVQVRDYDFVHKGLDNQGKDMANDAFILQELTKEGVSVRDNKIFSISDDDLATPELAKRAVEDILL